jgi:hypothetical protein
MGHRPEALKFWDEIARPATLRQGGDLQAGALMAEAGAPYR